MFQFRISLLQQRGVAATLESFSVIFFFILLVIENYFMNPAEYRKIPKKSPSMYKPL